VMTPFFNPPFCPVDRGPDGAGFGR